MTDIQESQNQAAMPPLTELPLKGYYGGKPTRISIEYDDYSSTHIGNADGSVDQIVDGLKSRERPTPDRDGLIEKLEAKKTSYNPLEAIMSNMRLIRNGVLEEVIDIVRQHQTVQPVCPYIVTSPATAEGDGGTSYCILAAHQPPNRDGLIEQLKDAAQVLPGFNDEMVRLSDAISIVRRHGTEIGGGDDGSSGFDPQAVVDDHGKKVDAAASKEDGEGRNGQG